jgi:hypothetical protein
VDRLCGLVDGSLDSSCSPTLMCTFPSTPLLWFASSVQQGSLPPVAWARFCCSVDSIKYSNMLTAAPPFSCCRMRTPAPPMPPLRSQRRLARGAPGGLAPRLLANCHQLAFRVFKAWGPVSLPSSCAQGQARRQLGGGRLGRVARGCNLSCCHARLWHRLRNRPCGRPAGHQQRQPAMRTACGWECVTATFSRRDGGSSRPVR